LLSNKSSPLTPSPLLLPPPPLLFLPLINPFSLLTPHPLPFLLLLNKRHTLSLLLLLSFFKGVEKQQKRREPAEKQKGVRE